MKQSFELGELLTQTGKGQPIYNEFLRVPAMSAGLYVLAVGEADLQQPHQQDELYYVVRGKAMFSCEDRENVAVQAGSILYVSKLLAHRFHHIEEELQILVFFAPAESEHHAEI